MTTSTNTHRQDAGEPISFIRWVFQYGRRVLTCEVMISGPHAFDVCVLSTWDSADCVIERYDRLSHAVRRQAEIAWCFRQTGWTLISNDDRPMAAA